MKYRDKSGVFRRVYDKRRPKRDKQIKIEHNYCNTSLCLGDECSLDGCTSTIHKQKQLGKGVHDVWRNGRRLIELEVLLSNLQYCQNCKLGPVPLTLYNVIGELQKGLSGYLYVVCQNPECGHINRAAYGKVHHMKKGGMPCFDVNTKLGTGKTLKFDMLNILLFVYALFVNVFIAQSFVNTTPTQWNNTVPPFDLA